MQMKKAISMLIALVLVFSLLGTVSYADNSHGNANGWANGNGKGNGLCYHKAVLIVDASNAVISAAVRAAQATPYDDVAELKLATDAIAASCKAAVKALGYDVECVLVTYIIDGQAVEIDPLFVIVPPGKQTK